ncbi:MULTISPECIES: UDP-N-acetylmuramoyl-tripeptide--D-alanyl-D-alanine ligase [unclassified Pseudofrankia]|uniref:UDP-N-acetylmuramoyl-tripeptide--D-alanyl-D- alanine ligase n=1 Tax=unclassified Pseudofrankia TaxID=2994372 RepID=UPI0008D97732|nr:MULTISPECIES: UDP-N-acetylmuramoyl-tripeptide--D-alanyl-D-alanine ligase [unclassified Pseudofrankia]MDT3441084.1 UDP-N-acetylmuramoyl-tripeptide--D-alanyl-D-alanine ligase [Pseudofrankia sp. BMG5.37]OHV61377.1 UDP-N-acetylmuramoyl-tripeptide--D-alanyl-D-alanine ligase [Pseudofrankia sp. BMG5.36]
MIPVTLAEVAAAVSGRLDGGADPSALVTSVVVDSRLAQPGALFVALPGERADGHDFAATAVTAGAVAVLAARPVGVPAVLVADPAAGLAALAGHVRDLTKAAVLAVTGSSGKTTTKDLLADLLGALGPTIAPPGSFNNEIGLPLTLLRLEESTEYAALEMGARGIGHIAALCAIARPHVGLVLNVGSAHVGEYADGRAGIAQAKGELAEAATDTVVLNADDPLVAAMRPRATGRVVTFGLAPDADVRAERVEIDRAGRASFDLLAGGERHRVALALVGAHQVSNALAAAAAAGAVGMTPAAAAEALAAARPRSRWRMEVTTTSSGLVIVNDAYNANPESMRAALRALVDLGRVSPDQADPAADPDAAPGEARRRWTWAVLGPMGELGAAADGAHAELGRFAAELGIDRVLAVDEAARPLAEAAAAAGARATWVSGIDEAAEQLAAAGLRAGDVVLVKASRSYGLERLARALAEPRGDRDDRDDGR